MYLLSPDLVLLLAPAGVVGQDTVGGLAEALGTASPFPWGPGVLLAGPALIAATLLWLYARTARLHRQAQLAPPTWLLPYLETAGEARPSWPPLAVDADDAANQADRELSVARLGRRKRILLAALALNFVAGWAVAGVYLYQSNRTVEFQEFPSAAELGTSVDTANFAGIEGSAPATPPAAVPAVPAAEPTPAVDTTAARVRREQRQAFFRQRDSLVEQRRLDSVAIATAAALRVRDSLAQAVRDSIAGAAARVVAPPPAPPPTAPAPAAPLPPDPAVERAAVAAAFRAAGQALVGAINGRRGVADQLAAGAARDGLLRFVEQSTPAASLESVAEPTVSESRADVVVTVGFQWRGPFGDTRRRSGRFRADAVRGPSGWRVTGLVPLDNLQ